MDGKRAPEAPTSIFEIMSTLSPAASARSSWVNPRRLRCAASNSPNRFRRSAMLFVGFGNDLVLIAHIAPAFEGLEFDGNGLRLLFRFVEDDGHGKAERFRRAG